MKFTLLRFIEIDDFFESIKYKDFTRWYPEKSGPKDIRELHKKFNKVNETIRVINKAKETQHLYLQKILELVDTGIIAYNIETGTILWANDTFKKILDIPSVRSIDFIKSRKPELFTSIFKMSHATGNTITINTANNKTKILISNSVFHIKDKRFNLIALQNIDDPLNRKESEAWKKLLSVMTHEIMNSIAPISSLAETLQTKIQQSIENPELHKLEINDLDAGIESIKNRSVGLMKFAKTYRSLNKITTLSLAKTEVSDLFENLLNLLHPTLMDKNIELQLEIDNPELEIKIDKYLIEQVLINLMLNSIEACKNRENSTIKLSTLKSTDGRIIIKVIDNGKGIPNEIIDDVFVPFFSTKKTGSGIGLSLCKQIMLLHNGKIQLQSIENKGTSVSLVF